MKKSIIKNFLDTIVLAKLKTFISLSGYDIIQFLHKKYDTMISPGTVYSLLYSLERRGLIEGRWVDNKREYSLSENGLKTIEAVLNHQEEIRDFIVTCISC